MSVITFLRDQFIFDIVYSTCDFFFRSYDLKLQRSLWKKNVRAILGIK